MNIIIPNSKSLVCISLKFLTLKQLLTSNLATGCNELKQYCLPPRISAHESLLLFCQAVLT